MPLNPSKLSRSLEQIFHKPAQRPDEIARVWAQAYSGYALDATAPLGGSPLPPSIAAGQGLLYTSLMSLFSASRDQVTSAQGYSNFLTAFWMAPPVVFAGAPPGLVTLVPGAAIMAGTLLTVWGQNLVSRASPQQAAQAIAQVLDTFTRTVIVTQLPPGPGPPIVGPIS